MIEDSSTEDVHRLLIDSDPDERRHAVDELAVHMGERAIPQLVHALTDENKGVRDAAMSALSSIGGPAVAAGVVELIHHADIASRNLAGEVLLRLRADAVPALLPYISHADHDVRKFAADILGLSGCSEIADSLLPLLDDNDENAVIAGVEALGNLGTSRGIPALLKAYESKPFARVCIAEALGKTRNLTVSDFLLSHLKATYEDVAADPLLQFALTEALGYVGDLNAYAYLLGHLTVHNATLKRSQVSSLIQIAARWQESLPKSEEMKRLLIELLDSESFSIRHGATKAVSEYPSDDVTRALVRSLGYSTILDALLVTTLSSRQNVFEIALDVLEAGEAFNDRAVIVFLGQVVEQCVRENNKRLAITDEVLHRTIGLLSTRWETADEELRAAIVDVLFRLDGDSAVQFLDHLMQDPDPWLRMHILELLGQVDNSRTSEFITRFLDDENDMVREVALGLLQTHRPEPDTSADGEAR